MAKHIASTMLRGKEEWLKFPGSIRRPKGIVFSQHDGVLQGVGTMLIKELGDSGVCEHFGAYASSELTRFRHSQKRYQVCPLCGFHNSIADRGYCQKRLLLVEYTDMEGDFPNNPSPAGHGATGWGHYFGHCLCSPNGCHPSHLCKGYINPLNPSIDQMYANQNLALVADEHLSNYKFGLNAELNSDQYVIASPADPKQPFLWAAGRRGGRVKVKQFRPCSGLNKNCSWFGPRVLEPIPWSVVDEDAFVLMLQYEGSHGLDLSFVTHLFLLERIEDPALRNQIISRAHRVGATGPVHVHTLLVIAQEDDEEEREWEG